MRSTIEVFQEIIKKPIWCKNIRRLEIIHYLDDEELIQEFSWFLSYTKEGGLWLNMKLNEHIDVTVQLDIQEVDLMILINRLDMITKEVMYG
jgi:hypothetical protein